MTTYDILRCGVMVGVLLASSPAQAEPGCSGCNVVDSGRFGRGMIGYTVYREREVGSYAPAYVLDVDTYSNRIYWEDQYRARRWTSAREFYTETARNERLTNAAGVAIGVGILGAIYCSANPQEC